MPHKQGTIYNPERLFTEEQVRKYGQIDKMFFACEIQGNADTTYEKQLKTNSHILAVILKGKLEMIINGNGFSFSENQFINIPSWAEITGVRYSSDFHAKLVAAEENLVKDIFQNRNPLPPDFRTMVGLSIAGEGLTPEEVERSNKDFDDIITALSEHNHTFAEEISYAYFYILITDLADMICRRYGKDIAVHMADLRRSEGIMKSFVELLSENILKETEVGFYAEKLCISKQYLASIVKEKTRVTVSYVISSVRMEVATKLLRDPELTLEQIAEKMSFSDRSSFGKFFKKKSGTTPTEYRRNIKKTLLTMRPENVRHSTTSHNESESLSSSLDE